MSLTVYRIDAGGANVIYAWRAAGDVAPGSMDVHAEWRGAVLHIETGGSPVDVSLRADGKLVAAIGSPGKRTYHALLTKT